MEMHNAVTVIKLNARSSMCVYLGQMLCSVAQDQSFPSLQDAAGPTYLLEEPLHLHLLPIRSSSCILKLALSDDLG